MSCQKCHKSDPGAHSARERLDFTAQGLDRTFAAAAIHGSSLPEGDEGRQMVYCELYKTVVHAHTSRRPAHGTHVARSDTWHATRQTHRSCET